MNVARFSLTLLPVGASPPLCACRSTSPAENGRPRETEDAHMIDSVEQFAAAVFFSPAFSIPFAPRLTLRGAVVVSNT